MVVVVASKSYVIVVLYGQLQLDINEDKRANSSNENMHLECSELTGEKRT